MKFDTHFFCSLPYGRLCRLYPFTFPPLLYNRKKPISFTGIMFFYERHHDTARPACLPAPESLFASAWSSSQYLFKARGRENSHSSVSWLPGSSLNRLSQLVLLLRLSLLLHPSYQLQEQPYLFRIQRECFFHPPPLLVKERV